MANTTTTNYAFVKPEVGADTDAWGTHLNADLDSLDSTIFTISGVASAALPKAGGTMTGALVGAVGALSTPGYTFAGDLNTGAYWIGADHWALVAGGVSILDITTTTVTCPVALTVTGAFVGSSTGSFAAKLTTVASAVGNSGLVVPHGTAPTSPNNGDVWSTTAGFFHRVNGSTLTVAYTSTVLLIANNLSDVASAATSRTNLGLGTAAVLASTAVCLTANNLSDVTAGTARTNLGLGSAAVLASTALLAVANNLSDLNSASTARTNLGLGGAALLAVGTTAGTVCAGDDTRITGAALKASNLSDLASVATARTNLGLGTAAVAATGTSGTTIPLLDGNNTWSGTGTHSGVETFNAKITAAAGIDITAALASMTTTEAGYMGMPQNSQSVDYTLVAADRGKSVYQTGATKTFTIPANASVAFPIGTVIALDAASGVTVTIAVTSDTLRLVPTNTTGSRTLAGPGSAYIRKMTSTEWWIRGDCT